MLLAYFENRQTEKRTPLVEKIEKAVEEANKDKKWRREIMMLEMKLRDERKAGLREGLEKGKKEIAVKLLRQNHPIPFIVDVTGLSEEAVLKLKHTIGSKK